MPHVNHYAPVAKSVMARLLPLTPEQRAEMQVLINQGIDALEARALVQGYVQKSGNFDEAKHPRDHGKFSEGAGAGGPTKDSGAHLREAKREQGYAKDSLRRAQSARASGDNARAEQHLAEHKQHMEAARAATDAHHAAASKPSETKEPAAAKPPPGKTSATSDAHFANAENSFARADRHMARAAEERAKGNDKEANAHVSLAANANASARRELTQEKNEHERLNTARAAQGKEAFAHDDARHDKLAQQHEENRAKIEAARPKRERTDTAEAASHTERAEHAVGEAKAAEHRGDVDAHERKMGEAKAEARRADAAIADKRPQTAEDKNAVQGAKTRNANAKAETKRGVDRKHLDDAAAKHKEAQQHDKQARRHEKAGAPLRAAHHTMLAERARSEGDASLGKFAEALSQAADYSLKKSADAVTELTDIYVTLAYQPVRKADANEIPYINEALNLQPPLTSESLNDAGMSEDVQRVLNANRLVQGMDMEMQISGVDAERARKRAGRAILDKPGYYDVVGATPDVLADTGVMLDLGSGQSRALGHLGIDLHPYDYGTVLWDLDVGIPFPDGCARAIRMTHSLHDVLDAYGEQRSPVPLLLEVQRVLKLGGMLYYEGPEPLYEDGDPWPIPGLVIVSDDSSPVGQPSRQSFKRVPLRVPAFPGADARYQPASTQSVDEAMALLALNDSPAEVAMANLISKSDGFVPIVKADSDKQICYGEVLNPLTIDAQNDWLTAEDIEKAAHDFMMTSRVIGSEHGDPIGASVVESFIAPQDLSFSGPSGPVSVPKGSWLIGVKVTDPKEWAAVKRGDYSGFSIGGFGTREPAALAAS